MVIEKEYELLLKRFRHLLESDVIRLYDEVDPQTGRYKRDIKDLDRAMRMAREAQDNYVPLTIQVPKALMNVATAESLREFLYDVIDDAIRRTKEGR